ncbi:hypothetical protein E4T42_05418 [Aureobasidium subglaciale]|nr:hypothetical protein E4T42_05418 [Aureobasidium subglaciale]
MSHQSHLAFSTVVFPNRLAMSDGMSATQLDLMSDSSSSQSRYRESSRLLHRTLGYTTLDSGHAFQA